MARPSKYNEKYHVDWARSLAMEGLTEEEIADRMGITRATIWNWKKHEEFKEALETGKEIADAKVEHGLYRRAVGYRTKDKKVIVIMDNDGNQRPARIETTEREVIPDTTAQIFWLKNRKRDKWKDKWDVEVETDKEITFNIVGASQKKEEEE